MSTFSFRSWMKWKWDNAAYFLQCTHCCGSVARLKWVYSVITWSRVSSGSIVSDYGLDVRAIGVRSLAGAKDFSSSLFVQTGSGAHPASCTMGTGCPFPGGKSAVGEWRWPLTPSSAKVVNEWELYLLSPQAPPWRVAGLLYFLFPAVHCCGQLRD
jgi:hypothetical protein